MSKCGPGCCCESSEIQGKGLCHFLMCIVYLLCIMLFTILSSFGMMSFHVAITVFSMLVDRLWKEVEGVLFKNELYCFAINKNELESYATRHRTKTLTQSLLSVDRGRTQLRTRLGLGLGAVTKQGQTDNKGLCTAKNNRESEGGTMKLSWRVLCHPNSSRPWRPRPRSWPR